MEREPEWEIFFDEHPKPSNFEDSVLKIHHVCHQSTISKTRVALITVNLIKILLPKLLELNVKLLISHKRVRNLFRHTVYI